MRAKRSAKFPLSSKLPRPLGSGKVNQSEKVNELLMLVWSKVQQSHIALLLTIFLLPVAAFASNAGQIEHDPISQVIFWVTLIFAFALFGRFLAKRFHQPGVLGELLMGVIVGNLCYFFGIQIIVVVREGASIFNIMRDMLHGMNLFEAVTSAVPNEFYAQQVFQALSSNQGIDYIKVGYTLDLFSRYGVIFLLFMVGLESSVQELKHTGMGSLRVAVIGVVAPVILGFICAKLLLPDAWYQVDLFVAATLSATSIGITARVLSEMKQLNSREAKTILGAAMIDDVLGLVILAVVSSMVIQGQVDIAQIGQIVLYTVLFFLSCSLDWPELFASSS